MIGKALTGISIAGLATWAGFQSMWPTSQVYGRTFIGLEPGSRQLALTYDDGPNDPWTLRLLDVLDRHQVEATFFLIGRYVRQKPEIARAIVAAGQSIGSHTWDHPNLIFTSAAELRRQVEQTHEAIVDATGVETRLFRPPFGGRRPGTLRALRSLGLQPIMWNITCYDWKLTTAERILAHINRQRRGGDVILLHDGDFLRMGADRGHTIEATDRLIPRYADEGADFVTIPQMISTAATR